MKIIILTGRFGLGHIKAAESIREELLYHNPNHDVIIIDFIEYMFPNLKTMIYGIFNFLVSKCSGLYNVLNEFAGKNTTVPLKWTVVKKLDKLIREEKPERIIVTFPVCTQYISRYKETTGCNIPMYTFITDITAHGEWIAKGTDCYYVGDISTKNTLLSKGVSEDKIKISGIPVSKKFYDNRIKPIGEQKKVLVMGGGLGLIQSMERILDGLSGRKDVHVTVITGKNKKLKQKFEKKYPQMQIVGFTNIVETYMKQSDLLVTKAGGITTFEAIAANTPLYILKPFLEQEFGNARYIEEHNIGRVFWDNHSLVDEWKDFLNLLEHPTLLVEMQNNMLKLKKELKKEGETLCN